MKVLRDLNERDFADHLIRRWQYQETHPTGSHIGLWTEHPFGETLDSSLIGC